nr:MAG TPA: hypothetical protein [Caudoviricetes sp.]
MGLFSLLAYWHYASIPLRTRLVFSHLPPYVATT